MQKVKSSSTSVYTRKTTYQMYKQSYSKHLYTLNYCIFNMEHLY